MEYSSPEFNAKVAKARKEASKVAALKGRAYRESLPPEPKYNYAKEWQELATSAREVAGAAPAQKIPIDTEVLRAQYSGWIFKRRDTSSVLHGWSLQSEYRVVPDIETEVTFCSNYGYRSGYILSRAGLIHGYKITMPPDASTRELIVDPKAIGSRSVGNYQGESYDISPDKLWEVEAPERNFDEGDITRRFILDALTDFVVQRSLL